MSFSHYRAFQILEFPRGMGASEAIESDPIEATKKQARSVASRGKQSQAVARSDRKKRRKGSELREVYIIVIFSAGSRQACDRLCHQRSPAASHGQPCQRSPAVASAGRRRSLALPSSKRSQEAIASVWVWSVVLRGYWLLVRGIVVI